MNIKVPHKFGFYAILTNPVAGYERLASILVEKNVAFVQLRMKDESREEVLAMAKKLRPLFRNSSSKFIINDYPDIAAECGAHGVHIGQDDVSYEEARRIVGPDKIVGLSTHNLEQVRGANRVKPDYIGIGPVFATTTKKIPDPELGLGGMREMIQEAEVPHVVLGSVNRDNLGDIMSAGALNYSCVRPVNLSKEPGRVVDELLEVERNCFKS